MPQYHSNNPSPLAQPAIPIPNAMAANAHLQMYLQKFFQAMTNSNAQQDNSQQQSNNQRAAGMANGVEKPTGMPFMFGAGANIFPTFAGQQLFGGVNVEQVSYGVFMQIESKISKL